MDLFQLHFLDSGSARVFDVRAESTTIGRIEGNDLVLNHPSVSRRHARIDRRGQTLWVIDLKSTNGVKLNGNLVTESQIRPGDKISIGSVELDVRAVTGVDFSDDSPFDNPSGTVIRKISDFNSEFGLDVAAAAVAVPAPRPITLPGAAPPPVTETREKIFAVLVQVAKVLLQSDNLDAVLNNVMDIIFRYLPVERGLLVLFDDKGNPVPRLTKFLKGARGQEIPISRTILKMVAEQQVSLLTSNALEDARLMGGQSIAIHGIRSAMCVPLWHRERVIGAVQVDSPIHIGRFTEQDLDLLTALANFAAVAIERAQLNDKIEHEQKIRSKLERYHSPGVVEEIVRGTTDADGSEVRSAEVSILFADISGFTTVSETLEPEEVSAFLANFFSCAVEAIFAHGGTLDKFIGDAVMAFFGAPIAQEDHAARAIKAGLLMQKMVGDWNSARKSEGLVPVKVRVGINSGRAVVGNVGTEKRVDYTVLGTSVNIASRLESGVAKPGDVVISQNTYDHVKDLFDVKPLGEFPLKGLQQKMPVYSVRGEMKRAEPARAAAAASRHVN